MVAVPADRDTFFGRASALKALTDMVHNNVRLVTILGIGGMGKTRLAATFARSLDHSVLMLDLIHASTPDDVVHEALSAANIEAGQDPENQWLRVLKHMSPVVVIADNFEHLIPHAAQTLGAWLDSDSGLRVVVTSRERLGLSGEAVLDLGPMTPEGGRALLFDRVARVGSRRALGAVLHRRSHHSLRNP